MKGNDEATESVDEMGGYMDILNLNEPLEMKGIVDEEMHNEEIGERTAIHFYPFPTSKPQVVALV